MVIQPGHLHRAASAPRRGLTAALNPVHAGILPCVSRLPFVPPTILHLKRILNSGRAHGGRAQNTIGADAANVRTELTWLASRQQIRSMTWSHVCRCSTKVATCCSSRFEFSFSSFFHVMSARRSWSSIVDSGIRRAPPSARRLRIWWEKRLRLARSSSNTFTCSAGVTLFRVEPLLVFLMAPVTIGARGSPDQAAALTLTVETHFFVIVRPRRAKSSTMRYRSQLSTTYMRRASNAHSSGCRTAERQPSGGQQREQDQPAARRRLFAHVAARLRGLPLTRLYNSSTDRLTRSSSRQFLPRGAARELLWRRQAASHKRTVLTQNHVQWHFVAT